MHSVLAEPEAIAACDGHHSKFCVSSAIVLTLSRLQQDYVAAGEISHRLVRVLHPSKISAECKTFHQLGPGLLIRQ